MSSRVRDRLRELRRRYFVGRNKERSLFDSVLKSQIPWQVIYIFGCGGVGKTTLLHEFSYLCEQTKTPVVYLDSRNIKADSEAFVSQCPFLPGTEP